METKKSSKANLENYSKVFMLIGLVLALFITYVGIEHKTYEREISSLGVSDLNMEDDEQLMEVKQEKPPEQKPPPAPKTPDKIEVVEDEEEVVETIIESTETDEDDEVEEIVEVEIDDVEEDVIFAVIEDVPIFPGCKGKKEELKKCFEQKVQKHINRKFNTDLASELGLESGVQRIFVGFKIDKTGKVVDVRARSPHKKLQAEAERVVKSLPKFTPGKQRGRAVGVKYSLPIRFQVE